MRVGFLLNRAKPEALEVARELEELLRASGCAVAAPDDDVPSLPGFKRIPVAEFGAQIDVLIVLGGDGTFLRGASLVADHGVPLLGINLGSLGFVTQYSVTEARAAVAQVAGGAMPVEERMRLRVGVIVGGREVVNRNAVNDAVVTQPGPARLVDLAAVVDGAPIATFKADGLIVATPTGSTAYSLAAGGPILTPEMEALVLTPISPHTLTHRPVVFPATSRLRIGNVSTSPVVLTVDGQWNRELAPGDAIEVCKADKPLRMFKAPGSFFTVLRQKLSWGER